MATRPTAARPLMVSRKPTSAMPTRNRVPVIQLRPASVEARIPMVLRQINPSTTAHNTGLTGEDPPRDRGKAPRACDARMDAPASATPGSAARKDAVTDGSFSTKLCQ